MLRRRLQVLAEGEDVNTGLLTRAHALGDLIVLFAETEHDGGLRDESLLGLLGVTQDGERLLVPRAWISHSLL